MAAPATPPTDAGPAPPGSGGAVVEVARRSAAPGLVLVLVCLGQFMVVLDVSVVNVALPSIRADLGFTASSLQWVVNAYTLAFAGFLLLGGRAADIFGRRRMFLIGVALFGVASLLGGLATNSAELVAARAVQGLGGAVLSPATLTILLTTYGDPGARARALGVWSAVAAAGGTSGALVGGVLTDLLSWRWILFVNVPIAIGVLLGARLFVAESRNSTATRHLDVLGAATATGGLVAIVTGIVRTESQGWGSLEVLAWLAAGVVLLAVFVLVESRVARAPIFPFRLLRSRSLVAANAVMFSLGGAMFALWYFLTLHMQLVLGESPLQAGLGFMPQTLMIMTGAQISSRLLPRIGARPLLVAGPLLIAIGLVGLSRAGADGDYLHGVLLQGMVTTFGFGLSMPAVTLAATAGVARAEAGLASGIVQTTRQMGGSLGLAALAAVAAGRTADLAGRSSPLVALDGGFTRAFTVGAVVAGSAALAALMLPGREPRRRPSAEVEAEAAAA